MRVALPVILAAVLFSGSLAAAAKKAAKGDPALKPVQAAGQSTADLVEKNRAAIVMIETRNAEGAPGGLGTGFFVSTNGLVATSLHVIGEGRPLMVRLADGTTAPVSSIYAWDRHADLAIVKVGGAPSTFLPLSQSEEVKQGTEVVAMGHPLGLAQSVVEGVVSARREIDGVEMLQLAMPIEPGNSGGPVVDRKGRVVGIVNSKAALTRNLGFATSVNLLAALMAHPNGTTMERWLHYNSIDTNEWTERFGADWHSHGAAIEVESPGDGFGGRALLLRKSPPPSGPFEISVEVRLDDESGAAGLVFDADGGSRHYGFYPTGGRIRTTAFGGPDVGSWRILATTECEAYRQAEWNLLRVRVSENGFQGYVNDELVFSGRERVFGHGLAGLAKFRNTAASFRGFQVRALTGSEVSEREDGSAGPAESAKSWLAANPGAPRMDLLRRAHEMERMAAEFRRAADRAHQSEVAARLKQELDKPEEDIDLVKAALWLARYDQPGLDVDSCQRRFDGLVREARSQIGENDGLVEKVGKIRRFLFEESGFHGNRFDYYNLANCHLNSVLDEREGIPVTLAVLYLEICSRLGVKEMAGLPLPGHFMVRFSPPGAAVRVIDVFDQGHELSFAETDRLIAGDSDLEPQSATAKPASKREILLRIVSNLRQFTLQQRGLRDSLPYVNLQVELSGDGRAAVASRLDRAGMLVELGEKARARDDLRWIVDHRPDGIDIERVEEALRHLEAQE